MTKIINGAKNYLAMKRTLASALVAYLLLGVSTGVSAESMTFACKEIHAQDKHTFKYSRLGLPEQHIRIDLGKSQVIMNEQMWFPVRASHNVTPDLLPPTAFALIHWRPSQIIQIQHFRRYN